MFLLKRQYIWNDLEKMARPLLSVFGRNIWCVEALRLISLYIGVINPNKINPNKIRQFDVSFIVPSSLLQSAISFAILCSHFFYLCKLFSKKIWLQWATSSQGNLKAKLFNEFPTISRMIFNSFYWIIAIKLKGQGFLFYYHCKRVILWK